MTSEITYKGGLRCECIHIQSGTTIETDAPTDNKGKGEKFSPTDLLCVSLATCIVTTMAINAESRGINLINTKLSVQKHMASDPRRIKQIDVVLNLAKLDNENDQQLLERIGNACPVKKSLHADMEVNISYIWS